jgi:beta-galactosidase
MIRLIPVVVLFTTLLGAQRGTSSLDGVWQLGESVSASDRPTKFDRAVPVPGLAHSATPPLPLVDEFESFELSNHRADRKSIPESQRIREGRGRTNQPRNYLWYRRSFTAPEKRETATLKIAKGQFGVSVWLNDVPLGEYTGCFSASFYDASRAIRWGGRNELIVRIGAHPGVLPKDVDCGQDGEKNRWTPGIYDSVSLLVADNPLLETVQAAPRLSESGALIQVRVANRSESPVTFTLKHLVMEAASGKVAGRALPQTLTLQPRESKLVDAFVRMSPVRLWSPEDPFLYRVESTTGGDSAVTRFGMREFRFDSQSGRAMLNGKPYYLRGSNITLHRFFEDPLSGTLPWDEKWVRRLLVDIPREMHWNSFRFCIGPVPDRWLQIADEAGLLIQNEYFFWTKRPTDSVHMRFPARGLIQNLSDWMRDNWNHPSVVIWDANNETIEPDFAETIIPAVRHLDLSSRPWDNGWNPPAGATDPIEDHLYEFNKFSREFPSVYDGMTDLKRRGQEFAKRAAASGHARILNEYGWNWLNRDGSPTELTRYVYEKLPGADTSAKRIEEQNYLLAGVTEFWRSTRIFAGVLHFVYLTSSDPGAFTADHFRDVRTLELHEPFLRYMREAFKPLGVYIDEWRREHKTGSAVTVPVQLTNDYARAVSGSLTVEISDSAGRTVVTRSMPFHVDALSVATEQVKLHLPAGPGSYRLTAIASEQTAGATRSVRKITVVD